LGGWGGEHAHDRSVVLTISSRPVTAALQTCTAFSYAGQTAAMRSPMLVRLLPCVLLCWSDCCQLGQPAVRYCSCAWHQQRGSQTWHADAWKPVLIMCRLGA
jgi:hypothetical protein